MNETKFTCWRAGYTSGGALGVWSEKCRTDSPDVCRVASVPHKAHIDMAHLIAAAPDLYAEVDAMRAFDEHVGACPRCSLDSELCARALTMLRVRWRSRLDAYRKARGEK